jgi:hypothetical protein
MMKQRPSAYHHSSNMAIRLLWPLCLLFISMIAAIPAALSNNLTGSIELSGVNSNSDTLREQSLNQQYALYWQRSLTPYVYARTSLTYYNFGSNQNIGPNSWRKEFSRGAELNWKHPNFSLGTTGQRRKSSSNDHQTDLTTDFLTGNLRTRLANYPYLEAQFQRSDIYNSAKRSDRDTRDFLLSAGTGYTAKLSSIAYSFSRRNFENRINQRRQIDYQHSLLLNVSQNVSKDAVRISAGYRLDYRQQSDIAPETANLPREIPGLLGLYANDATPDLGSLDTIPSLVDGILTQSTFPPIDIGNGNVNWNLGADLGSTRSVSEIYVYTDAPSGNGVRWQVYKSSDNIVWNQMASTSSLYSVGFSRYEISFPVDTTRYIKVVNSGLNDVPTVFVTEIEVLIDIGNQGEIRRHQTTHLATLSNSVRFSSKWISTADIYLRRESGSSLATLRDETNYTFSTRYKISPKLQSGLRYELGLTDFINSLTDIDKTSSVSYDLRYNPLETLAFLLSMASRHSYIKSMKTQEYNNVAARVTGDPLTDLHATTEFGWSRNNLYQANLNYDAWTYRLTMNGGISPTLDAGITYLYQRTTDSQSEVARSKSQYSANVTYNLTANIFLQGNVSLVNDFNNRLLSQDYLLSWSASRRLSISASTSLTQIKSSSHSNRYNAQLQYYVTPRGALTVSYSRYDLAPASNGSTAALQVGFRTGF